MSALGEVIYGLERVRSAMSASDEEAGDESWRLQRELLAWYAGVFMIAGYATAIAMAFIGNANWVGVVTSFTAGALVCGEIYYRRTGKIPSSFFAWWMAGWFTIANAAITLISFLALLHASNQPLPGPSIWQLQAIVMAIIFVGTRFLFRAGARRLKNLAEKKAKLSAPKPTEDELEMAELEGLLTSLEAIPAHHRTVLLADERSMEIRARLAALTRSKPA